MQEMHEIQGWPVEHSQNYLNPSIIILFEKLTLLEMNDPMGQRSGPSRQMQM